MGRKRFSYFMNVRVVVVAVAVILVNGAWAASTEKVIHSFTGGNDGINPAVTLAKDAAGNFYGTTVSGGTGTLCTNGCGTVFKLSRVAGGKWKETVLYNFTGGSDGKNPYGGVTLDSKGDLYGTTVAGGSGGSCAGDGCGVVFLLSKSGKGWVETVMYNFTGGKDGFGPGGALVFDSVGNLYGTTPDGGNLHKCNGGGCGVVYQISPVRGGGWKQTVLHTFGGSSDGRYPSGSLAFDAAGNLYGTTQGGGAYSNGTNSSGGTVYQVSPTSGGGWTEKVVHSFGNGTDGLSPRANVIVDKAGNLYGTTIYGGTSEVHRSMVAERNLGMPRSRG